MSKSENKNAKIFYRIFPMERIKWDYLRIKDKKTVYMRNLQELAVGCKNNDPPKFWEFKTDGIFFNNSQEFVYTKVIDGVLDRVSRGYNGIIAAFGQTGTGKTVTLGGLQLSEKDFGITPRVIFDLLELKKGLPKNIKMCIQLSYTEFSKSSVADLLKEYPNLIDLYKSREVTKIKVTSEYEALKLIYKGEARKTFASNDTYMSNLCTSIVTFHITTKNLDYTCPEKITSRLHIIDMVGVDTVGNISSVFKNPYEIGKANIIKTNLEQFLLCLIKNIPTQIKLKERTNPLIYFLGNDLSNESILRFVGHIRVLKEDLVITISMLRFGQLVRGLKPKLKEVTSEISEETKLQYFQNQLEELQRDQLHCSVLLNQDLTKNLNQDRIDHIQRIIQEYLRDQITEINILNIAEAFTVFKEFKEIYSQCESEKNRLYEEAQLEISMKHKRDSKSNSKVSLKSSRPASKRTSKKSRESFMMLEEKKKREDGSSIQSLSKKSPNKVQRGSSASSSQLNKRRSTSSGLPKRSSINRRKSVTSTSVDKKESRSYLNEIYLMPDIIPEYKEAWFMYVNDDDSSYKTILEYYRTNDNDMQFVYATYLTQMKRLQYYKEIVEKRKNEVLEAQMIRMFNEVGQVEMSNEEIIPGSNEKLCQDNLSSAKIDLLEQQEVVLKWQSELKICLNNRREIKSLLIENFENFCKEKFVVPIPSLSEEEAIIQEITPDINVTNVDEDNGEDKKSIEINNRKVIKLNNLKKIMERELHKDMQRKANKNTTWKNFSLHTR